MLRILEDKITIPIQRTVTSADGDGVITLFDASRTVVDANLVNEASTIHQNYNLRDLRCTSRVKGLKALTLPDFELTDSDTEKLAKTKFLQWEQERRHIDVFLGNSFGWDNIATVSLINSGYPYSIEELMPYLTAGLAYPLDGQQSIGIQVVDAGFGGLAANERLTFYGAVICEIKAIIPEKDDSNISFPLTTVVTPILPDEVITTD